MRLRRDFIEDTIMRSIDQVNGHSLFPGAEESMIRGYRFKVR